MPHVCIIHSKCYTFSHGLQVSLAGVGQFSIPVSEIDVLVVLSMRVGEWVWQSCRLWMMSSYLSTCFILLQFTNASSQVKHRNGSHEHGRVPRTDAKFALGVAKFVSGVL